VFFLFLFSALVLLGDTKGTWSVKSWVSVLLMMTIWLVLCTP